MSEREEIAKIMAEFGNGVLKNAQSWVSAESERTLEFADKILAIVNDKRPQTLTDAVETAMVELGAMGTIDTDHPAISALMNALQEVKPV